MDLSISETMQMQQALYERHRDTWSPLEPEFAKDSILYMIEEIGEAIAVIKKKGSSAIMEDPIVREAFLSEMADILMYYHDVLLRFHVTPDEISRGFTRKHNYDMKRDYAVEYKEKYNG